MAAAALVPVYGVGAPVKTLFTVGKGFVMDGATWMAAMAFPHDQQYRAPFSFILPQEGHSTTSINSAVIVLK
jgi:hypothetical protein